MDSDLELLRFVFNFHVVDLIVQADQVVEEAEIAYVVENFPRDALASRGLIDEKNRLTDLYRDLLAEALMRLPAELDQEQKLELIDRFFETAMADGHFEKPEKRAILVAANLLGVPPELIHHHLHDLGTLDG
ncbi:MAG: TerB family tellurite resistance protein [Myxococcales bacterium]|nr:TerB family tellurite resistance protein [Myxococcales bacterium]MCA9569714.1 TerB family tellurite resistance protein [Myxococcales bacterium]MCB9670290.1 TerB family tellurite resistance protein [Alphaproteobacteria bacterium]